MKPVRLGRDKMEQVESTYTCPLCGKEHNNDELCPIVLDKRKKIRYNSQSYLMGSIILECFERQANFWGILQEIVYYIEKVADLEYGFSLYFNADFIISYFAASLECPPSKFYKKLPELSEKYSKILEQNQSCCNNIFVKTDDNNNIDQISMELDEGYSRFGEMITDIRSGFGEPKICIDKVFNSRKPSYQLRLDFDWLSETQIYHKYFPKGIYNMYISKNYKPKNAYVHYGNLSFGEHSNDFGFNLCAEKEGALKDYFESLFDDYYDWTDIAEQNPCSYSVAYDWVARLEEATLKGLLIWSRVDREEKTSYSTTYGESKIKISIINGTTPIPDTFGLAFVISKTISDEICVFENERRIFHYGGAYNDDLIEAYDGFTQEIIQEPMIRRLSRTIDQWNSKRNRGDFLAKNVKKRIRKSDVLSVTYSFICSFNGHIVIPYCGLITVITPDGEEIEEKVYLGYCRTCDIYYIFKRDYENICKKGEPQCKVVDAATNKTIWDASFDFNKRSILFEMGYNVQASNNLSAEERQQILKRAIEEKRISVNEILNLLEMQIALHSGRDSYSNAIDKWKEDSNFVKEYGIESGRIKKISKIHG